MEPKEVATVCESGQDFVSFNFWDTQSVEELDKLAEEKVRLFGISYYLFGSNLYSCQDQYLLRHNKDWKNQLRDVANRLSNI